MTIFVIRVEKYNKAQTLKDIETLFVEYVKKHGLTVKKVRL